MTKLEFTCSDEKSVFLLKAARLYDEGVKLEPVRHGYWKSRANFLECSECGHEFTQYDWEGSVVAYYYCPNCGAKMHLEVQDG